MKRKLLSIILAVSTLLTCTFSVFGSGCNLLGGKDEFTQKVEAIEKNCTIGIKGISPSTNKTTIMYMVSETRVYLFVDDGYNPSRTGTWVAENGTYRYWEFGLTSGRFEEIPNKTKAEFENAKKNSFYIMFGCFVKNSKEFEYDEKNRFYSNEKPLVFTYEGVDISSVLGQPAGTTTGVVHYKFDNIVINVDNEGNIVDAEYQWVESYDVTDVMFIYECELSKNEYPIPHPEEINAGN